MDVDFERERRGIQEMRDGNTKKERGMQNERQEYRNSARNDK